MMNRSCTDRICYFLAFNNHGCRSGEHSDRILSCRMQLVRVVDLDGVYTCLEPVFATRLNPAPMRLLRSSS